MIPAKKREYTSDNGLYLVESFVLGERRRSISISGNLLGQKSTPHFLQKQQQRARISKKLVG